MFLEVYTFSLLSCILLTLICFCMPSWSRDVTPHVARTIGARTHGYEQHEEVIVSQSMSYAEELMHSNPSMDFVRAQQLENWAEQREISSSNKYMYFERTQESYDVNINDHEEVGGYYILRCISF